MSGWDGLGAELDAWAADGRTAAFWWRDDDAVADTPPLRRLLGLRRQLGVPLALAVIPAKAGADVAALCAGEAVDVLQHGYAHANHRPEGTRKAELGADRELWDIGRELADGRGRMIELFGSDGWEEVLVPPWNRIDPAVTALLPGLGFRGLSGFGPREWPAAVPDLAVANTHVDIIDWTGPRGFPGEAACLSAAVAHLAAKREGSADAAEPTGILTHHLVHDDACWAFVERFVRATAARAGVRWRGARDMFTAQ